MQLDMKEGAVWAYRLLLNSEPPADGVGAFSTFTSLAALRAGVLASHPYALRFETAGHPGSPVPAGVDLRAGVTWAYRLFFAQEPTAKQVAYQLARVSTIDDIKAVFLLSREFELAKGYGISDLSDRYILNKFAPFCSDVALPGFFKDFLGSRTRCTFLPVLYENKSGSVEGGPNSAARGMHATAEWVATLRSVLEAKGAIVAVELGAGWAPWLVTVATAAAKRGLMDVRLIGVEGSEEHAEFCRQHFRDNGIDPDQHTILHAVVGERDGVARFPRLVDARTHYGASASFDGACPDEAGYAGWDDIESISVETLLRDVERVDILHSDVQGVETAVLTAAMDVLDGKVRRIVIGTHSRRIETELFELFSSRGWILEHEQACVIHQREDARFDLVIDGEQIWRNARL